MARSFEQRMNPLGLDRQPETGGKPKLDREGIRQRAIEKIALNREIAAEGKRLAAERRAEFRTNLKNGVIGLFRKVRGFKTEAQIQLQAAPEYLAVGKDYAKYGVGKAYEGTIDTAKRGYAACERRVDAAHQGVNRAIEAAKVWRAARLEEKAKKADYAAAVKYYMMLNAARRGLEDILDRRPELAETLG